MNDQNTVSRATKHTVREQTTPQALSFIVRIWRQGGLTDSECRGWVEHVQTGRRTAFLGLDQLRSIIAEALGHSLDQDRSWRHRLARWKAFVVEQFAPEQEGEP